LSAVVYRWNKSRKRNERQGILVEEKALRRAEKECLADTAKSIAEHACLKHSGRVGRSAAAKKLDDSAVRLAVVAHVRHAETNYDELLMEGWERFDARGMVKPTFHTQIFIF
jgi:hypothetical protein